MDKKRFFVALKEESILNKRDVLIEKLIDFGIFKIKDKQLFELPIDDLEQELKRIIQSKKIR